jgi:LysM repeat protein
MKPLFSAMLACLLFPTLAAAAVEFTGVLVSANATKFSLRDTTAQGVSPWLALGDSFAGYTLSSYDTKTEMLLLVKGEEKLSLHLTPGKVVDAPPAPPSRPGEHVLKPGETAAGIARQYQMTLAELTELNPGVDLARLRIGQKLRLR